MAAFDPVADIREAGQEQQMSRSEFLKSVTPHLIADVRMFNTTDGGRKGPAYAGWGCPCMTSKAPPLVGYDAWPLIGDDPLLPGDCRRLGFYFLSYEEAVPGVRQAGRFYLWEGGFIGEAEVVD